MGNRPFFYTITLLTLGIISNFPVSQAIESNSWQLNPEDLTVSQQSQTTPQARTAQKQEQIDLIRPERYNLQSYPVTDVWETQWRKTLWATAVLEPQENYVGEAISGILNLTINSNLSESQTRTIQMAMQVGTQLYLSNPQLYTTLGDHFQQTLINSPHPEWVAMALSALIQGGMPPKTAKQWLDKVQKRFPDTDNLSLQVALRDIEEQLTPSPTPPLADLLRWQINPQQAQIYVLCRPQRQILCQTLIKDRYGNFIRQDQDHHNSLWSMPLLSRSLHGLRWNFIRGYTPQGIYRIEGTMPRSQNRYFRAYGQFPLIKVFLPLETEVNTFLPSQADLSTYNALLPPSWRNYFPIQQSYWAGKLGRSLIRIHGSGESVTFFGNNRRFPPSYGWNPAIGCLSAQEEYDEEGRLKQGDMPKILQTFSQAAGGKIEGYLIVLEIPGNEDKPISLAEIEAVIR